MTDEQKVICHNIADYYGEKHQMLKAIEEMAELTQAIIKYIENPCEWDAFCGELADVNIMIEQLNYLVTKWVEPRWFEPCTNTNSSITMTKMGKSKPDKPKGDGT